MCILAAFVAAPVQALDIIDDMDNIFGPWTDDREPGEGGIGLLQQGHCETMKLDYGNTTDSAGVPHPEAGYDLNGNWVGHGNQSGGAFNSGGGGQDEWDSGYRGKFDRVPSRPFAPGEIPCLTDCSVFVVDVYKSQMGSEHARSLQLYDSTGARSTYHIQSEGSADPPAVPGATRWGSTIGNTPAGWSTFCIPINAANVDEEDNADKCDIVTIKIWCSSWAAIARELNNPYEPGDPGYDCWPCWTHGDWMATMHSGGWIELNDLRLITCDQAKRKVAVDIKPQSCPNPLNKKGRGVLPVAILGFCGLDVADIDAASIKLNGVPALRSALEDVAGPATVQVDSMDNIFGPWTDDREPGEGGIGLLHQNNTIYNEGTGSMGLDYGNTTDSAGVPHPEAGYDRQGNWVGHAPLSGGAFNSGGGGQDDWDGGYRGKFDRVPSAPFAPGEIPCLTDCSVFVLDVYKAEMGSEHARSLQLYDSTGARSTYHIQSEGSADPPAVPGETKWGSTIGNTPAGWNTFCIPINAANVDEEDNADKCDIVTVKIWCSSWAAIARELCNPYNPGDPGYDCWPCWTHGDWMATMHSGREIKLDNLRLADLCSCVCTEEGPDGVTDLVLKFDRRAIAETVCESNVGDEVPLTLTGSLNDCTKIEGTDCVVIRGKAKAQQKRARKHRSK